MKALSLWQPWASLVALGVKTIETRSWSTSYRGPLYIHASKNTECEGWTVGDWHWERGFDGRSMIVRRVVGSATGMGVEVHELPFGAIVATCTLVDVVPIHEQLCDCGPRPVYVGRGMGGLGREVLGLYLSDGLAICPTNNTQDQHPWIAGQGWHVSEDLIGQLPYGDYQCGRYAWLLADIKALAEPIPARGRQGLWNWQEAA